MSNATTLEKIVQGIESVSPDTIRKQLEYIKTVARPLLNLSKPSQPQETDQKTLPSYPPPPKTQKFKEEVAETREAVAWASKTEGLICLKELGPFKPLGHGVPTIRGTPMRGSSRDLDKAFEHRCPNVKTFEHRLTKTCPALKGFDFANNRMVLAGGAVAHHVGGKRRYMGDYDIFLVGHSDDASAIASIKALGDYLNNRLERLEVHRTVGCVTFTGIANNRVSPIEIQVVLSRYVSIAELLYSFDLGSSAVAYDGKEVWLSWPGKLAFERGVNVLDLAKCRASYERRIGRYFGRGFDLVVPDLDMTQLSGTTGIIELPRLNIFCCPRKSPPCYCCIFAHNLMQPWPEPGMEDSSYQIGKVPYGNAGKLLSQNIYALAKEDPAAGLCARSEYVKGMDATKIQPQILLEDMRGVVQRAFGVTSVNYKKLLHILGAKLTTQIVTDFLSKKTLSSESLNNTCSARIEELKPLAKKMVIPFTLERAKIMKYFPLTGISKAEWYGEMCR